MQDISRLQMAAAGWAGAGADRGKGGGFVSNSHVQFSCSGLWSDKVAAGEVASPLTPPEGAGHMNAYGTSLPQSPMQPCV